MSSPKAGFSFTAPSHPKFVGIVRLVLGGFLRRFAVSQEEIEDIKLAVGEAWTWVATHGRGQNISVECKVEKDFLQISFPVNRDASSPVIEERSLGKKPGENEDLGLLLINSLMDKVLWEKQMGKESFSMKKFFGKSSDGISARKN